MTKELNMNRLLLLSENQKFRYGILFIFSGLILLSSFLFNGLLEIIEGFISIILSSGILMTDYIEIGNLGASFFNSGIMMLICLFIAAISKSNVTGALIAAIFTVGGFSFFGKNVLNIWPILIGVYLFAKYKRENFGKYIIVAFFGTAMSPLVSQVMYGIGLRGIWGILLGFIIGITVSFFLPPLANSFVKFHMGYNVYNVGFTAGIIGTLVMALFRGFGIENEPLMILSEGNTFVLSIYFLVIFSIILLTGFYLENDLKKYIKLLKRSGKLVTDFVALDGFGITLVNMGALGLISTAYVLILRGELNGPIIAGIFTVVGFGAFGKHIRNVWPILVGVSIASYLKIWGIDQTSSIIAGLFGTTLAPIAGEFGWKRGVLAGFLHVSLVMNVGYLHGGMNLYNNGFSGGLIAAILVPIFLALKNEDRRQALKGEKL